MKALLKISVPFPSFQCHHYPANIEQLELIFPGKKNCGLRTLLRKYDRLDRIRLREKNKLWRAKPMQACNKNTQI